MKVTLKIWRQARGSSSGRFVTYPLDDINEEMSFLEMLDVLNEKLVLKGEEAIAFDHDCREGICGTCGLVINGRAHGPEGGTTVCQLHMRKFRDGDEILVEPWRTRAFPVVKDLVVDKGALDRVIQAGGFVALNTGSAPDANAIPIPKDTAEKAMDAAACIGCGACIAACPNASAMLFVSAKISHLALLPQGKAERIRRVREMVGAMDREGFGSCTNHGECEGVCPKEIKTEFIARLNREFILSALTFDKE